MNKAGMTHISINHMPLCQWQSHVGYTSSNSNAEVRSHWVKDLGQGGAPGADGVGSVHGGSDFNATLRQVDSVFIWQSVNLWLKFMPLSDSAKV